MEVCTEKGMKVTRRKTENVCVNDSETSGTVKMQEVENVDEFKHLGSSIYNNGQCTRRESAGREEWVETSVRGDV